MILGCIAQSQHPNIIDSSFQLNEIIDIAGRIFSPDEPS